jgi:type VI secretion system secreted protein Hcp
MPSDVLLDIISPRIQGESEDKDHPGTIEVASFNTGVQQEASMQAGAGLVAGGSNFGAFTIQKKLDSSSTKLFGHLCAGARINSAKVYIRRPGEAGSTATNNQPVDYMIYEFEGLQVVSFSADGGSSSAIPDETIAFNFTKKKLHYREIKDGQPQGPVSMEYDLKKNQ